jgi:hypothetical protein
VINGQGLEFKTPAAFGGSSQPSRVPVQSPGRLRRPVINGQGLKFKTRGASGASVINGQTCRSKPAFKTKGAAAPLLNGQEQADQNKGHFGAVTT